MHPNPAFRRVPAATSLAFARDRGFGTLCVNHPAGPLLAHVPFLIDEGGAAAEVHLVRSNPIVAAAGPGGVPAVIAVAGPDGYVSPDWYGLPDQVPTWNYVAVHLRGTLAPLPDADMEPMLDRLSAAFEARLAPKRPWTSAKMSEGVMPRMMRQILPFVLRIEAVEGTWKLNQNKPGAARLSAAAAMAQAGDPGLAALMADPPADGDGVAG